MNDQIIRRYLFWNKAAALLVCILLMVGCASAWKPEGSVQSATACPVCGWPVELYGTEVNVAPGGRSKEVVTYYQCYDWACGYGFALTNRYAKE